ncbi:hypothetical protein RUND412_003264 [Rhizina undulata]
MYLKRASFHNPTCLICNHSRLSLPPIRHSSNSNTPPTPPEPPATKLSNSKSSSKPETPSPKPESSPREEEPSALTRRFESLTESALEASPRAAARIASENPSPLAEALAARIAATDFTQTHAQSISIANLPSTAGKHTRETAAAQPWTGTESTSDAVLRMLVDTHKPLRGELAKKLTGSSSIPANVDLRPQGKGGMISDPQRVVQAREKSTEYTLNKDPNLSERERSEMRQMFRERFLPGGRPMVSLQDIASLADERIEEARARGQFKNLPRGKPLERDHNADSPFLDTTEYFLNRIIKKQDIVPPWIEKQQELARALAQFRKGVGREWRRHVAREIACRGGTLEEQCKIAEEYARAEKRRVALEGRTRRIQNGETDIHELEAIDEPPGKVFRDKAWEKLELKYHQLSIQNLNSITRSYNLMAPELAKKPYFSLERELSRCFAECAPQIADELRERSKKPNGGSLGPGKRSQAGGAVLDKFAGETAEVRDSTKPNYGFKELWRDIFGRKRS